MAWSCASTSRARPAGTYLSPADVAAELGDQPVAVAAVDRADVLDDLALAGPRRPLEQECRRVQRHAQVLRLLLGGHCRLDHVQAPDDVDAVPVGEQGVERVIFEILRGETGNQRRADVE